MPSPEDHFAESYKGIHESTQVMAQATMRMAETQQILAQTQLRMEATHRGLAWLQGSALVLVGFCLLFTGYLVWQHLAEGQEHAALMQGLIETLQRLP